MNPIARAGEALFLHRLRRDDRGATALEYGIVAALVAAAIVVAAFTLGGSSSNQYRCTVESWEARAEKC